MTTRVVHRPARDVRPVPAPEPLELSAPPLLPDKRTGGPPVQALLPMVGAMSSMTMMITLRNNPVLVAVGALVMVVALLGGVLALFGSRAQGNRQRRLHRERYLDYLEELSERLLAEETGALRTARIVDPDPAALPGVVLDPARRWDRRRADSDFLRLRLGTGTVAWREVTVPDSGEPTQPTDEFMKAEAERLAERYRTAPGLPLPVPLDRAGDVAVVGPSAAVAAAARALLAQAAAFHAPDDVAIALAVPPDRGAEWLPLGWLPHVLDDGLRDGPVPARRIGRDLPGLARTMAGELSSRATIAAEARRGLSGSDTARLAPRLLVLSDSRGDVAVPMPLPDATLTPADAGITVLHLVTERLHEPSDVTIRITVDDEGAVTVEDLRDPDAPVVTTGSLDPCPPALLAGVARSLAALRLSRSTLAEQVQVGSVDTAALLGVERPEELDVAALWQPRAPLDFLRVPIGVDDGGAPLLLDLKESAQLGMGPHGLCVGATGSGKSELLRTLVATLAVTHPPDDLAMVLVDYKGGAAFAPFAALPHVAGLIDNLADEPGLIERVHASLQGEIVRRQRVLRDAGNLAGVDDYRALRDERPDLPPLPHLLVVIDEFGELLTAQGDFIDLFLTIGRIGRSIGVHLLLSSQRIEAGKLKGLETYLSYRLGLRTFSEAESQVVLDTGDAFHLPSLPGYGFLKVDTSVYTRFRSAFVSGPATRTVEARPAPGEDPAGGRRVLQQPLYPGLLAANGVDTRTDPSAALPDRAVRETVLGALLERVGSAAADGRPTRTIWLPPLPRATTLDRVVGRTARGPRGVQFATRVPPMHVPVGALDDPARQRQEPWLLDLTAAGGHAAVIGGPQAGKTTWLRTLVAGLALTHTPSEVSVYGLDLAGEGLAVLREFPHVGGVAVRTDRERLLRTMDELTGMLDHRELVFRDHSVDSMADLRRRRAAGDVTELPSADVVLVVDGAGTLKTDHEELEERVTDLLVRGPGFGVHVVLSLLRWNDLKIALQPTIGTRVELRLNDPGDSVLDRKLAATLSKAPPGRALLVDTRTGDTLVAQTALPRSDGRVPEVDDRDPDADATADVTDALRDLGRASGTAWDGRRAPAVRVLPATVRPEDLPDEIDEPDAVPIGIAEATLAPATLDLFGRDQHLLVLGDAGCGKTTLLRGIAAGLAARHSTEELVLAMYDPRRGLTGVVPTDYVGGYAGNAELGVNLTSAIVQELSGRMPDAATDPDATPNRTIDGPRIVLLVDDHDVLTAGGGNPLEGFLPFLPSARDIGLHVVLSRPVAGWSGVMFERFVALLRDTGGTGLIMNGDRSEGAPLPGTYAAPQPPGRGFLVRRGEPRQTVQVADFGRGS
ncbi:type VII secretion protein EccC [Jatrophihabitans fulvus]